jgi:hypothetical protein
MIKISITKAFFSLKTKTKSKRHFNDYIKEKVNEFLKKIQDSSFFITKHVINYKRRSVDFMSNNIINLKKIHFQSYEIE